MAYHGSWCGQELLSPGFASVIVYRTRKKGYRKEWQDARGTGPFLFPGHIKFQNPITGITDIVFVREAGVAHPSPTEAALAKLLYRKGGITEVTIMPAETSRYFCWQFPLFPEWFYFLFQFKVNIVLPCKFRLILSW